MPWRQKQDQQAPPSPPHTLKQKQLFQQQQQQLPVPIPQAAATIAGGERMFDFWMVLGECVQVEFDKAWEQLNDSQPVPSRVWQSWLSG
jgi:hypothetical protein